MDPKLQHGFRLGDCVVHPLQGLIERPDGSDHVQPKVMEVLLCLAERPGEVVERDDLVTKVWAKTAVTDEVLTRCISELRNALGDHRESPRYVQTIPKRGYRLVAAVQGKHARDLASESHAYNSSASSPAPGMRPAGKLSFWSELRRRNVLRVLIAYAAVAWLIIEVASVVFPIFDLPDWSLKLVVALAFLGFPVAAVLAWAVQLTPQGLVLDVPVADRPMPVPVESRRQLDRVILMALLIAVGILSYREFFWEARDRVGAPAYQNSVAVLRFLNIGDDADDTVFSDGLAVELLNVLARIDELKVPDRTWTWRLAAQELDAPELADRLGVSFVLGGSVRIEGDRIRTSVHLVDENGYQQWSQDFDRMLGNFLGLQAELARAVVNELKIVLSLESETQLERTPTDNPEAYLFYLRASDFLRQPNQEQNLDSARELFEQAVQLDPRFALAYAGLCETWLAQYQLHRAVDEFEGAERACHRALTLDDRLSGVHVALGSLYRHSGQYDKAETEFTSAIERDRDMIVAYVGRAETYAAQQRFGEAEEEFKNVIFLEPGYWDAHNSFGRFLFRNGRFTEAIEQYEAVKSLNPKFARAYSNLAAAHYMMGDYESAAQTWLESIEIEPTRGAYANLGSAYFFLGRFADSVEMYREAIELTPEDHLMWGFLANSYRSVNGQEEEAAAAYQEAISLAEASLTINLTDAGVLSRLGIYYASTGEIDIARARINRALELAPDDRFVQYDAAITHIRLGDIDLALDAIERAVKLGLSPSLLMVDAGLTPLMNRQRFKALVALADE